MLPAEVVEDRLVREGYDECFDVGGPDEELGPAEHASTLLVHLFLRT